LKQKREKNKKRNKLNIIIIIFALLTVFVGIPLGLVEYQLSVTGKTWGQMIGDFLDNSGNDVNFDFSEQGKKIDFLIPEHIGDSVKTHPQISNLLAVDLDNDQLMDVVVCDALDNKVTWIRQYPSGVFTEQICADRLIAPSHIQAIDFDQDGDTDLIVSVLGMLFPSNDKIGSIVILENDGKMNFFKHIIVENIARVSDVRAGDLDGDGDMDLAAVQFGYDDGETRWLRNLGNWKFESTILQTLSGGINCELLDIDKDSDLDIITLISQEWEEIYLFINDGEANFKPKLLYGSKNSDFGSSGIYMSDLDQDGDEDILYTNGDAFDYMPPTPRPWHGVNWLENKGEYNFEYHRITKYSGAYNARPWDIDHDGDLDIFVVSTFNWWYDSTAQSFIWLENNGEQKFIRHDITNNPTHILALELADFNNDNEIDAVTGGMHVYPPFDRIARIMLWKNNWKKQN
jgi:hypothetical protein